MAIPNNIRIKIATAVFNPTPNAVEIAQTTMRLKRAAHSNTPAQFFCSGAFLRLGVGVVTRNAFLLGGVESQASLALHSGLGYARGT
jgi:hypothetical protein